MREWRNWQTRTFEGRVVYTVRVQVPFLAPRGTNGSLSYAGMCGLFRQPANAGMAELADALDSGSSEVTFVQVQVLLPAPTKKRLYASFFVGLCEQSHLNLPPSEASVWVLSPVTRTIKSGTQ